MKYKGIPIGILLLQGLAFAARTTQEAPKTDYIAMILAGFNEIMAGSLGLKLAVVIVAVAGVAVGYWQGNSGF